MHILSFVLSCLPPLSIFPSRLAASQCSLIRRRVIAKTRTCSQRFVGLASARKPRDAGRGGPRCSARRGLGARRCGLARRRQRAEVRGGGGSPSPSTNTRLSRFDCVPIRPFFLRSASTRPRASRPFGGARCCPALGPPRRRRSRLQLLRGTTPLHEEEEEEEQEELEESRVEAEMGNPDAPGPNSYFATIVDPKNARSYCLDIAGFPPHPQRDSIEGRGCKAEGEDAQFKYDPDAQQSVPSASTGSATRCTTGRRTVDHGRRTWL
ncbi:unnamed protein product [Prorocentrum cordatum]|uniref:Uncharacterized protein n=1 Tax=Prorocentrum cordatum TaxID=2364126 RepID=A0ABN9VFX2_9DINO|nr:unnamed protein product [Polarella glacialis]